MSGGTIANDNSPDVLIIGGGLAGLTAAVDLSSRGVSVMLVEQRQHLGGRTYSFVHPETGDEVDNGQHLLMGCYHSTLRYLQTIGSLKFTDVQRNLSIFFRHPDQRTDRLQAASLPAPLNVVVGLLRLTTLTFAQRLALVRVGRELLLRDPDNDTYLQSITVNRWLDNLKQSPETKKYLWDIIAIGALNDSTDRISAALFVKVLKSAFFGSRKNSSMVLPTVGLSSVLVDPAADFIRKHGGTIRLNTPIYHLECSGSSVTHVQLESGETIYPGSVISSVPYYDIPRVFRHPESIGLTGASAFVSSPIVTIHLWFDSHFVKEKFTAMIDSPLHWVFNKTLMYTKRSEGLMYLSIVVSGAHEMVDRNKDDIVQMAYDELKRFYPSASLSTIVHSLVMKEKRATFSPTVSVARHRPTHHTAIQNLFLSGDWTDTRLPATIEGAVQSGYAAAALAFRHGAGKK